MAVTLAGARGTLPADDGAAAKGRLTMEGAAGAKRPAEAPAEAIGRVAAAEKTLVLPADCADGADACTAGRVAGAGGGATAGRCCSHGLA